jgi:hypothetical protein
MRAVLTACACVCASLVFAPLGFGSAAVPQAATQQAATPSPAVTKPAKPTGVQWQPGVRAAIAYARTGFAVRTEHRAWGWRVDRTVPSASILKAMLLVAYLDDGRVRNRPLDAADHRLIDPMIERSDNEAATRVLEFDGPAGVYGVAHRAGMRNFTLDDEIWGLSRIEVVPRHRAAAMHLLASVIAAQRWGIGRLHLPGWQLYFKGGWGAGTGEVEHQSILLRHGAVRVAASVLITSSPSHEYAKRTLQGVFEALLRHVGELLPG